MLVVGRRLFPWLLWQVARTGSRELFTLCVIAAALGIAYGASALFGASFALGAFFAGMVLRESDLSYRAAQESLPLRDAFSVLFFVSAGMLFDPAVVIERPLEVLAVLAVILVGKSVAAFLLVLAFRYPLKTALTVSASLAQIGEFSFILAGLGVTLGLLPVEGQNYILAGAIISIALNPIVFRTIGPVEKWLAARPGLARRRERRPDTLAVLPPATPAHELSGHVVLVGYGRVGRRIGQALTERGLPFVVVEQNRELVERLRDKGTQAVAGDASDPGELAQAHVARARMLVIAIPDSFLARQMIEIGARPEPGYRDRGSHAQRGGSRIASQRECRQGLHGRARTRRRHDPLCAAACRIGLMRRDPACARRQGNSDLPRAWAHAGPAGVRSIGRHPAVKGVAPLNLTSARGARDARVSPGRKRWSRPCWAQARWRSSRRSSPCCGACAPSDRRRSKVSGPGQHRAARHQRSP